MSIIIYKQNADLYALGRDSVNTNLEVYSRRYTGFKINVQPAGLEYVAADPAGAMGKVFKAFTTYSGCMQGMMVVTSGTATISGMRYSVIGREEYRGPLGKTYELLLRLAVK